jgi:8-oxo-dGTP pyrophosphatase MutT (NUDIX family)
MSGKGRGKQAAGEAAGEGGPGVAPAPAAKPAAKKAAPRKAVKKPAARKAAKKAAAPKKPAAKKAAAKKPGKAALKSAAPARQLAALPWRRLDGHLQILVITSRETRRWVIPKGWPMAGRTDAEAAAQEAFEEAGLRGVIAAAPIGSFPYLKQVKGAEARPCEVAVYPLEVTEELAAWPEAGQRLREWVAPGEAAARVDEPELRRLILDFRGGGTAPPVKPPPGPLLRLIRRLLR